MLKYLRIAVTALSLTALLAIIFCYLLVMPWQDTTPRGPLVDPLNWPEPIRDLHADMISSGINVESFEVFLVHGRPGDTDSTVICRMSDSPTILDFLTTKLEAKQVDADKLPYMGTVRRDVPEFAPANWWVEPNATAEYFASRGILEGSEGDWYRAVFSVKVPE
jgi:hypothetical protein